MRYVISIFWVLVILLGATFASLNPQTITIHYYIDTTTMHLPLLLLDMLFFGAVLGMIAGLPILLKCKQHNRRLKRRVKEVEQEVMNLRTIPIKDSH